MTQKFDVNQPAVAAPTVHMFTPAPVAAEQPAATATAESTDQASPNQPAPSAQLTAPAQTDAPAANQDQTPFVYYSVQAGPPVQAPKSGGFADYNPTPVTQ